MKRFRQTWTDSSFTAATQVYAEKLSRNKVHARQRSHGSGELPYIGECGGFLYLQEYLKQRRDSVFHDGVLLCGGAITQERL